MNEPQSIEEIIDNLYWGGYHTHKAAVLSENARGLKSLEDSHKDEAKAAIEAMVREILHDTFKELASETYDGGYKYWKLEDPEDAMGKYFPQSVYESIAQYASKYNLKLEKD